MKNSVFTVVKAIGRYRCWWVPPALTAVVLLCVFKTYGLYPFGRGSVAWCDMNQQGIPLLMDLKDILSGKDGWLFSVQNAGGMNFWGVFCFFLSNPFSLLAVFVPKTEMVYFVNVLVILKLPMCALTAAIYFHCQRKGTGTAAVPFSVMYALCGYGMLFYQNIMWLDVMYLFPLLLIGLERLTGHDTAGDAVLSGRKGKASSAGWYVVTLSAITVMNFYLCYMVVVFILLYMTVFFISARDAAHRRQVCLRFLCGSLLAALLTAAVWLPCLIQVRTSGRVGSVFAELEQSGFLSKYETVLPLLFCTGMLFTLLPIELLNRQRHTQTHQTDLLLFLLMLVPFFVEPINLIWHTGSYMAFPARYGFITVLMGLVCGADHLSSMKEGQPVRGKWLSCGAVLLLGVMLWGYYQTSQRLIDKDFNTLTKYTATLWGKKESLDGLARLLAGAAICYGVLYLAYRHRWIVKRAFVLLLTVLCCMEGMNSIRLYMVSPAVSNPQRTVDFAALSELSDNIMDEGFYRVKTDFKAADYNMVGALGYPSISHYTSLTDSRFMQMQRLLGYSTVWMKSGSSGGTELTNALYSIRYGISQGSQGEGTVYTNGRYRIHTLSPYLDLGVLCGDDLLNCTDIPAGLTRAEVQQYLFEKVFDTNRRLVTLYDYDPQKSGDVTVSDRQYRLPKGTVVRYRIAVTGQQSLYADVYDRFSHALSEEYFESVSVKVNGRTVSGHYPAADENGLLWLGTFQDEEVIVEITAEKTFSCYSFGVCGLDLAVLSKAIAQAHCGEWRHNGHVLTGTIHGEKTQVCLLSVPYQSGLIVKVNGERVSVYRVLSDWSAFTVSAGENHVEVLMVPKGFTEGVLLTVTGIAGAVMFVLLRRKIRLSGWLYTVAELLTGFVSMVAVLLVYILPVVV